MKKIIVFLCLLFLLACVSVGICGTYLYTDENGKPVIILPQKNKPEPGVEKEPSPSKKESEPAGIPMKMDDPKSLPSYDEKK